jgi:hypothetical protein
VDVALGDKLGDVNGFRSYPQKILGFGEKVWISGFGTGKNTILVVIDTDHFDDGRYCGMLKFPYEKGHLPTPDDAVRMISEVLSPDPGQNQGNQPGPGSAQNDAGQTSSANNNGVPTDYAASVPGKYLRRGKSSDFVALGRSGGFVVFQDGKYIAGNFRVEGDTLIATSPNANREWRSQFVGNSLHDPDGMVWEKQAVSPTPSPAAAPVPVAPPPAPAPLPDIAPPPPPADVPPPDPPTVSLGQTIDQVTAGFGQPLRVAKLGVKAIFYYKDMKVTFTNGKVTNVE